LSWLGTVICATAIVFAILPVAVAQSTLHIIHEVNHDVSPPLTEMERLTLAQPNPFSLRVFKVLPTGPAPAVPRYAVLDTALQVQAFPPVAAAVGLNFEGLGLGQYGFVLQHAPPDSNGTRYRENNAGSTLATKSSRKWPNMLATRSRRHR